MIHENQLNPRVKSLEPSATLKINEHSQQLIKEGRDIIRLGLGQSPFPVPDSVVNSLQNHANEKDYLPVRGLQALRQSVADYYQRRDGLEIDADSVLIGPGSKELLFNIQMACQAELIIPAPSWVSYAPQALMLGRNVRYLATAMENQWQISPQQLEQLPPPGDEARLLLLNYPSNPTGSSYDPENLKALADVARRQKVIIIADEIYGETRFSGQHHSMAGFYPEGTIISSGLSKWCGAGGWRLGTMIFPKALRAVQDAMAVIASETFTSTCAPIQYAACTAFSESSEINRYLEQSRQVLSLIARFMVDSLRGMGLQMADPVGGFYLFVSFEGFREQLMARGIKTSDDLCNNLLSDTGIAMLPGSDFGLMADQLFVRMAFVDFDGGKALGAMAEGRYEPDVFVRQYCPKLYQACQRIKQWLMRSGKDNKE
ncbi:pyridoxal phosphate-dependent aminotransferase [Endozoicomonas sp. SCSIO W0465]|uniref:pyridoxal phosphate-dependent aminotransferase n=1 Tax=Endozoicomonas sp. SCSIO W0465 TaxID=2918516 RepID=UPI0020758F5B|nr:pyridoxal phosphate-dependent aminotransferase [Endozoicomonas sp. SCSIO W0465]USE38160.1 pyridoxal phosphate-dependent aminotransferase [Endozoicomonas sp. SCSIO W0465]